MDCRKRPQDENICPWEGTPADDTVINVSSSGRHATKESPEVGAKGAASSGPTGKPGLPRRGSDPALPVSLNKAAPPNKIAHSGNGCAPMSDSLANCLASVMNPHWYQFKRARTTAQTQSAQNQ